MTISASEQVQLWLQGLPPDPKRRVRASLKALAAGRPDDSQPLQGELAGFYRLRVGGYRIIYRQQAGKVIGLEYADLRDVVYETFVRLRRLAG